MKTKKNIIILSDTLKSGEKLKLTIGKIGHQSVSVISYRRKIFPKINNQKHSIILCELTFSNFKAMIKTISRINKEKKIPVVFLSASKVKIDKTIEPFVNSEVIFTPFKLNELSNVLEKVSPEIDEPVSSDNDNKGISLIQNAVENFDFDSVQNINLLVEAIGKALNATAALYNRLNDGLLFSVGKWNVPNDYVPVDNASGHICFDVITDVKEDCVLIRNLPSTKYFSTDPGVANYQLKTYFGKPIKLNNKNIGTLCTLFNKDFIPVENDYTLLKLTSSLIENSEKHLSEEEELWLSREWFNAVFKTSRDGIAIVKNNKIVYVNDSLRKDFLYQSNGELIGKSPSILSRDKDEDFFIRIDNDTTEILPHRIFEFEGFRKR